MNRIHILDESVANKIAAGEVVRRPASVVKELVENSIDAGASRIQVSVKNGGLSLIKVTDNGCGMNPEDALIAFERHATSKIECAEDLFSIETLGFRGEALPSIAVVSRMELITCPHDSIAGTLVKIDGGLIKKVKEIGAPHGTTVIVESLFYNTPARKKYLKSYSVEAAHVAEVIEKFILSHPEIAFRYVQDNHEIFNTSGNGNRLEVIFSIHGRETAREMMPVITNAALVGEKESVISVEGYIARPSSARNYNKYIDIFVNNRFVKSRIVNRAVVESYKELLPARKFPLAILNIVIDPETVDVNVHPAKEEVSFSDERTVYEAVKEACVQTLKHHNLIPDIKISEFEILKPETDETENFFQQELPSVSSQKFSESPVQTPKKPMVILPAFSAEERKIIDTNVPRLSRLPALKIIGQLNKTYIICESDEGMVIIDQHVAHERVIYDRLLANCHETDHLASQGLLFPITIELSYSDAVIFEQNRAVFSRLGFETEKFGEQNTYIIRAIPAFIGNIKEKDVISEIIDGLLTTVKFSEVEELKKELMTLTACKTALKAHKELSVAEMSNLVSELAKTENPYICPHGRPIIFSIGIHELNRRFKRA